MILVNYVPKKKKDVILLSTLHNNDQVDNSIFTIRRKEEWILDRKIINYTCKRQTKRWPFVI